MHGWTRPDPAGSGLAGGGPGGVSRGRTGPRSRVPEARGLTGPGGGTMMPGETHSAAPGTAADLSRCQGCASLQQVRRLPRAEGAEGLGRPFRAPAAGRAARVKLPCAAPTPGRKPPSPLPPFPLVALETASFALFRFRIQDSFTGMQWLGSEFWRDPCCLYAVSGLPRADL